jgi:hypothetical protein
MNVRVMLLGGLVIDCACRHFGALVSQNHCGSTP